MQIRQAGIRPSATLSQLDEQIVSRRLLDRLNNCADSSKAAGEAPLPKDKAAKLNQATIAQTFRIATLGLATRIVTACKSHTGEFEAFLQVYGISGWLTVCTYEFRQGRGRRKMYYASGAMRTMQVDLPASSLLEMAGEDFHRNWTAYYEEFLHSSSADYRQLVFPA
ncbi:MAG TPA: hypothetical protein V6D22_14775 [Candidatus Obscuribacterales bacterium]